MDVFEFGSGVKPGTSWITTTDRRPGYNAVACKTCESEWILPLRVGQLPRVELLVTRPGTVDDVLLFMAGLVAVSGEFRRVVREHRLTGLRFTSPLGVYLKKSGAAFDRTACRIVQEKSMMFMRVMGSGGSIALSNRLRERSYCPVCNVREWTDPRGKVRIVKSKWDGSDFFRVDEYAPVLMSEHAASVLKAADLSGFSADHAGKIGEWK